MNLTLCAHIEENVDGLMAHMPANNVLAIRHKASKRSSICWVRERPLYTLHI